jgi:Na+/H+-dicarboxylate symporter
MSKIPLHWQILLAIGLAIICGWSTGTEAGIWGITYYSIYDFIGTLFLNALKMIIVPLVVSSIIVSVANLGAERNIGWLGAKTIGFYATSSLVAILIGLVLVNLLEPGLIEGEPAGDRLHLSHDQEIETQLAKVEGKGMGDITAVFLRMVPPNIVTAAAEGQMLGLIFFSMLFGFFMVRNRPDQVSVMQSFWNGAFETMMAVTLLIMRFAPLGVFGLVAKTVAATGFDLFKPMMVFFITVTAALLLHVLVALPLALRLLGGVRPMAFYRAMSPALLTAFSTASSSATLPLTMECAERHAGISNRTTAFVLPMGATINMDGTALYECVAAMFIAQAYGLELGFATQFLIVLTALLTSIGVAGIPAASLVAIAVILGAIGLPLEGIGLLLVTDRVLDMMRTTVNVLSDSCCAAVIAVSEGEPLNQFVVSRG